MDKMEDIEMADSTGKVESVPKESNSENSVREFSVPRSISSNDNSNSDSEVSECSEIDSITSESSQHTFKVPDSLMGHRKGRSRSSRVESPTDPCHSITPAEWFLEKSDEAPPSPENSEEMDNLEREIRLEKSKQIQIEKEKEIQKEKEKIEAEKEKQLKIEKQKQAKAEVPLPYKEPAWSGKPDKEYKAEVLKSGLILEVIDLSKSNFYVVGRLPVCDISLAHPTISRYHAVFQYRSEPDEKNEKGLYLFDLGSTHGTFWNGNRIRPNMYVRIRGGHMVKFGNSQRKFIMQTPPEEEEEESELTVTELKEKRRLELEERMKVEMERRRDEELAEKLRLEKEENEGVDWGMGEDADEETDLTENPYAQTNNEELFLDDPKKTLRGWFEREGQDLQYQADEKGIGRFMCWVDLPIEDYVGRTIRAEATVKGKKKEAVVQCALEACRILDRHGLLRQAVHEGRKRKTRNWEDDDFYDSDEDNFLDRTGTVEKKREQRMRQAGKLNSKAETYTSLTEKHTEVAKQIADIDNRLKQSQKALDLEAAGSNVDALDAFMTNLKSTTILNKSETTKLKMDLVKLRKEEEQMLKLIEISKPANLPALNPQIPNSESTGNEEKSSLKPNKIEKELKDSTPGKDEPKNLEIKNDAQNEKDSLKSDSKELEESNKKFKSAPEVSEPKIKMMRMVRKSEEISENNRKVSGKSFGSCEPMEEDENGDKNDISKDKNAAEEDREEEEEKEEEEEEEEEALKRKMRNSKRTKQRALKAEKEKIKSYEDEKFKDDYCTWVPPEGQSGDGKTSLNEKFGY
ncbi:kanadaptin [Belonocnema kinseyi]|uniref:kanadaptin n=1 Tax=Belonocnema kinseyi TaxID=2817044 RepID=UPI00143DDA30|nr:kanadaptin [Belonocnema kinseyi]